MFFVPNLTSSSKSSFSVIKYAKEVFIISLSFSCGEGPLSGVP